MHVLTILGAILLALIVIVAISLFPNFLRYMKIRSM
jgi:hypothetical protein